MELFIIASVIGFVAAGAFNNPYGNLRQNSVFRASPSYYPDASSNYQPAARSRAALDRSANILRLDTDVNENGYQFAYETDNGIQAEEQGNEADGIQARGGYSYTGDDGQVYSVSYSAGANGFEAQGSHIPVAPPIPEEIVRALELNARDEAAGIFDDGSYHEGKYGDAGSSVAVARAQTFQQQRAQVAPARGFFPPQAGFRSRSAYSFQ